MATMGRYCKAYLVKQFREFSGWAETLENLRKDRQGEQSSGSSHGLSDDDILYLQENLVVTDGIFMDENIIYDQVTPEWEEFCKNTLKFSVPDYGAAKAADAAPGGGTDQE
jgi:hypothetical protein